MQPSVHQIGYGSAIEILDQHHLRFVEYAQARIAKDLRSKFSASDVVQATYLDLINELPQKRFTNREQFLGWFHRLLDHNVIDFCRGFRRSQKREISKEQQFHPNCVESCSLGSVLSLLMRAERNELLLQAIERLPVHNRRLIQWRFFDRMSFPEIASLTGRSEDCVRMAVNRSLEKLNQMLSSYVSLTS